MIFAQIPDFNKLSGKGMRCWKYIKTKEDKSNLHLLQETFTKNFVEMPDENAPDYIPKTIHWIWLGPKDFPEKSKENITTWIKNHPGWTFKLWTDRPRDLPFSNLNINIIQPDYLGEYSDLYTDSDNWGEKSDLLRLMILQKEGGLYVDHDARAFQSFANFHKSYNFYTGLIFPADFGLYSNLLIRNSIVGACPDHEITHVALGKTRERWTKIGKQFNGNSSETVRKRVVHRTFLCFNEAVLEAMQDPSFTGIIFPAGFFTKESNKFGIYADEDMTGSWYREEMNYYEVYLHKRVHKLMKRLHLFMIISSILLFINFVFIILLFKKHGFKKPLSKRLSSRAT